MRKKVLFVSILFLLTLILLPIVPIATAGPKPKEQVKVKLTGDDVTSAWETLDVRRAGRTVIVYSAFREPVNLQFKAEALGEFRGDHYGKFGFHIDKRTGEALIILMFDPYTLEELEENDMSDRFEGWPKYQLEKYGEWEGESIPIGTISASGDFTIYQMHYAFSGKKKSAAGVEPVWKWSGPLTLEIDIGEP